MATIAVIQSTNHAQGDLVLRGVFGTINSPDHSDPSAGRFIVDENLRPVSSVFSVIGAAGSPISPSEYQMISVPDADAVRVRDQLMLALQQRWRALYKSTAQGTSQFMSAMLQGEANMVERGVNGYFERSNKTLWSVPVVATMTTGCDGAYLTSEQQLLSTLALLPAREAAVQKDAVASPYIATGETLAFADGPAQANPDEQAPAWGDFMGIEAQVTGYLVVAAESPDDAVMAAHAVLSLQSQGDLYRPQVVPTRVLSTRELVRLDDVQDAVDTDDDDGSDDTAPRSTDRS